MIVVTVFLSILNQMDLQLVKNTSFLLKSYPIQFEKKSNTSFVSVVKWLTMRSRILVTGHRRDLCLSASIYGSPFQNLGILYRRDVGGILGETENMHALFLLIDISLGYKHQQA